LGVPFEEAGALSTYSNFRESSVKVTGPYCDDIQFQGGQERVWY
jgi:hypothetical protein